MPYNRQKMENALLALIGSLEFEDGRFWKGYDFDLLNSLHEQGLISQPWAKPNPPISPRKVWKKPKPWQKKCSAGNRICSKVVGHWLYVVCAEGSLKTLGHTSAP